VPYLTAPDRPALFYRDWGSGRPVLFCSAWSCTSAELQYQMAFLAERGFRVIAYDRRGHGRSDDPGRGYDYDTLADDLAALIDHLDLDDLTLVGHSMAGGEIVRYLTRHGHRRVSRLALLAATLPLPVRTDSNPDGVDPSVFAAVRDEWRRDYAAWLVAGAGPFLGEGLPGCDVSPALRDWTVRDMLTASLQAVIECNHAVTETDFRDEMGAVDLPTLIIQGDSDSSIDIELSGRRQHKILPNSRFIVYENAPHGLHLTHRDRLNNDLLEFLSEIPE
jgi:non-heme chloroperoxidase